MPVLLDPAAAWPLDTLLQQLPADGLPWHLEGGQAPRVAGLGTLQAAGPAEVSFFTQSRYGNQLLHTRAAAVIVTPQVADALSAQADPPGFVRIVCEQPYLLYARLAQWFAAQCEAVIVPGVDASARVAHDVRLGEGVVIGPHVVVGPGCQIADGVRIGAGSVLGAHCHVGTNTVIHPRVTLYDGVVVGARCVVHSGAVLGADGFGFAPDTIAAQNGQPGRWVKIPQLGSVRVGNDVEIGANTTIDRGALDDTVIADGVKLDDQIMIGHNVRIGTHTAIAACTGIAGSASIGARCMIGGAAMIGGHLSVADDVQISGGTAVMASIERAGRYTALYPISGHADWQKNAAVVSQLARLRRRLRALERQQGIDSAD